MATFDMLIKLFRTLPASNSNAKPPNSSPLINIELEELDHNGRRNLERRRRRYTMRPVAVRFCDLSSAVTHTTAVSNKDCVSTRINASGTMWIWWFHWFLQNVTLSVPTLNCTKITHINVYTPERHGCEIKRRFLNRAYPILCFIYLGQYTCAL